MNSPGYFKNFYAKRILRIFPLYYLSLIIFIIILPHVKSFPLDFSYYVNNQWWFWLYLQNWFLIFHDPGNTTTAIQHFWSLAVEEQFYLLWPLLIFLIKKPRILLWVMGILLLAIIGVRFSMWILQVKDFNYFGLYTFTRIDGICIGSMLAILQFMHSAFLKKYFTVVVLMLAGLNFLFYFFNKQNQFAFPYLAVVGYTTFATLFALLVYESVNKTNKLINFFLNNPVLRFFGKISYGLYVFHWPVYLILYNNIQGLIKGGLKDNSDMLRIVTSIILTLLAIFISIISFYFFERFFLKKKKAFN